MQDRRFLALLSWVLVFAGSIAVVRVGRSADMIGLAAWLLGIALQYWLGVSKASKSGALGAHA